MKEMSSLERCLATLRGEAVDYLPVIPQCFMFALETAGMKMSDVTYSGKKMAEAHILSREKYGYDGCVIDFDDATIAEACGAKVIFRDDEPAVVNEEEPVLKDLRQVYDMEVPDPMRAGRLPVWLEATARLRETIGNEVWIMGRADQGPFDIACLLRGSVQFMMDIMMEEEQLIHDVLDYCRKVSVAFSLAQQQAGAHATSIGEAFAGPNLISPDMYRQFAFSPQRRVVEEVQSEEFPFSLHICGNTNTIIEDMGRTNARIIEIDWQLDMEEARRVLPPSTILMGNVDPSHPLVFGTPEEVDAAVKRVVEATKGQGLVISSGCAMGRNTPEANMKAFVAAARKYGANDWVSRLQK